VVTMRRLEFMKRLALARKRVNAEISGNASGGKIASGLSVEGYAGGYRQALDDVDAMLRHGYPSDPRRYWHKDPNDGAE